MCATLYNYFFLSGVQVFSYSEKGVIMLPFNEKIPISTKNMPFASHASLLIKG